MKVVYTDEASVDLGRILAYTAENYPAVYEPFLRRLRSVILRIRMWPDSAREVDDQPGVRIVPLLRYPYNLFYRNTGETIEILYIHHAAQDERQPGHRP
jgi:plasmid stabilization system protein ParE